MASVLAVSSYCSYGIVGIGQLFGYKRWGDDMIKFSKEAANIVSSGSSNGIATTLKSCSLIIS